MFLYAYTYMYIVRHLNFLFKMKTHISIYIFTKNNGELITKTENDS